MGACLGACSLLSCASCLCGSAPCILCSCCPCSHNSTLSRLIFTAFLFLGVLVSIIMLSPGVESQLYKLPWVCEEGTGSTVILQGHIDCGSLLGHRAVYRMCFAMAAFFFLFTLLMICVRSSRDPRAAIQNGFWFFKFLIFVGITVGAFYIPDGSFSNIWFYFGVAGSFVFFLIQLVLLIDFAHSWNQRWLGKAEECDSRAWYAGLFFFTLLFYALSITAVALLFVYYTQPDACYESKVFIGLNLTLCVCVSIVAVLPKIQDAQPNSGLLQASVITLYTMFVTWLALSNVPGEYRPEFQEAWICSWASTGPLGSWRPSKVTGLSQPQLIVRPHLQGGGRTPAVPGVSTIPGTWMVCCVSVCPLSVYLSPSSRLLGYSDLACVG
uniref:Serine incorporator 2 isoform 1 n=1 Tax=Sus scrofa TaxID=9823 RepID=A0A480RL00_PIG